MLGNECGSDRTPHQGGGGDLSPAGIKRRDDVAPASRTDFTPLT